MGRPKKQVKVEKMVDEIIAEEPSKEIIAEEPSKIDAIVIDKDGNQVRTYTLADHGTDFNVLADAFAAKIGGKVI